MNKWTDGHFPQIIITVPVESVIVKRQLINARHMHEGYHSLFVCVCVFVTQLVM